MVNSTRFRISRLLYEATNLLMFKVLHDANLHPQHKGYDTGVMHLDIDLARAKLESD